MLTTFVTEVRCLQLSMPHLLHTHFQTDLGEKIQKKVVWPKIQDDISSNSIVSCKLSI